MSAHFGFAQVLWLALVVARLVHDAAKDGQPRADVHSFSQSLQGYSVVSLILYAGGFFG